MWRFTFVLAAAVGAGAVLGHFLGDKAELLKPLGDIFLNLLFCAVVPLVFFSMASAVAGGGSFGRLGKITGTMLLIFVVTGIISSCLMIGAIKIFDPLEDFTFELTKSEAPEQVSVGEKIVKTVTVPNFFELLKRENMLALIVFAVLTGLAAQAAGQKGRSFRTFLSSGAAVMGKVIGIIMLYAPVGLGAWFAYLTGVFGPQLLGTYGRALLLYYPLAVLYFFLGFTIYAFLASGGQGVRRFWGNILPASLTAFGTSSSMAALPVNLEAAKRIGVPEDVRGIVLPIGAAIHMDGTCLAAVLKISILFAIFGKDFSGGWVLSGAVGAALLAGMVMSGIPGGGFIGEMLIVSLYGFGPEALPVIAMLGTFVDPPATMVNSSGDTAAAMLTARIVEGKRWMVEEVKKAPAERKLEHVF